MSTESCRHYSSQQQRWKSRLHKKVSMFGTHRHKLKEGQIYNLQSKLGHVPHQAISASLLFSLGKKTKASESGEMLETKPRSPSSPGSPAHLLLLVQTPLTIRNWALACWTRLSCSDWLMLVKMPASGLKCSTLPWRFVRKWPKLRMQHTRTTHCGERKGGMQLLP